MNAMLTLRMGSRGIGLFLALFLLVPFWAVNAQEVNYKKPNYLNMAMSFNIGPSAGYIREVGNLALGAQLGQDGSDEDKRWVYQMDLYYSLPVLTEGDIRPWYVRGGVIGSEFQGEKDPASVLDAGLSLGYRLGYQSAVIGTNYLALDVGVISDGAFSDGVYKSVRPTAGVKWCFGF